ncbi:50S ribosomal protein L20 [candidate division NPL-UPA2 bacterium]|nr:50S ribosomal protein L20 [candidate division NPL-UPA2 bacterium]
MPRVKSSVSARKRHKGFIKQAKGYRGGRNRLYRTARDAVEKSWIYAFRDRKARKRDFRSLWISRVNAAARNHDLTYSQLIDGLNRANVGLNRKALTDLAINEPLSFQKLTEIAKDSLKSKVKG